MDLFTYLMAKNGHNTSVHGDLFSYLLGKGQSQIYTVSGTTIYIPNAKKLVSFMMTKESTQATSILPSGYTQVDYIQSSGTQYIDTNLVGNLSLEFSGDIVPTNLSRYNYLVGVRDGDYRIFGLGIRDTKKPFYVIGSSFNDGNITLDENTKYSFKTYLSNGLQRLYINDNIVKGTTLTPSGTNTKNIYLFTLNLNNAASEETFIGKLYNFKIKENDVLVRDFIPCYRNNDNEVGLYDLVNDVFYTNQGTGAFTYGSVAQLPNPDYPQEVKTVKGYRNLFDKDNVNKLNAQIADNNVITSSTNAKSLYIAIKENTSYTITKIAGQRFRAGTTSSIPQIGTTVSNFIKSDYTTKINITSNIGDNYLVVYYYNSLVDALTEQEILNSIQIVEGNQELPYVPYGNNYVNVAVSDGTNTNNYPIPLNNNEIVGIGDYKDELLVDKNGNVFINKKTGKVVYDGSESGWTLQSINSYGIANFQRNITDYISGKNNISLFNYFSPQTSLIGNTQNEGYLLSYNKLMYIRINESRANSVANFKNWLSTHNTEVYYVLETPELIDLQTTVDLKLFKGVNNVSNSEDGYMTIQYR